MSGIILPRRQFLAGLASALAAPAIVRVDSLMKLPPPPRDWRLCTQDGIMRDIEEMVQMALRDLVEQYNGAGFRPDVRW